MVRSVRPPSQGVTGPQSSVRPICPPQMGPIKGVRSPILPGMAQSGVIAPVNAVRQNKSMANGIKWLDELRATTRSPADALGFRYCQLVIEGTSGENKPKTIVYHLFEVDEAGRVVRQIEIHDPGQSTYRFDWDNSYQPDGTDGGGIRTDHLTDEEIEFGTIEHRQFEHAWLTGHLGERTLSDYRDEVLYEAMEDVPMLWEAWAVAEKWYPHHQPGSTLTIAHDSIKELLDSEFIELVELRIGNQDPAVIVPYPSADWTALLADRRSWMSPPIVWFQITVKGRDDLRSRGLIG